MCRYTSRTDSRSPSRDLENAAQNQLWAGHIEAHHLEIFNEAFPLLLSPLLFISPFVDDCRDGKVL